MATAAADAASARAWRAEALRLCERYLREVVLEFQLCPWAEPALRGGRVAREVCLEPLPTAAHCLPFLEQLRAPRTPAWDVGLLIFPRHAAGQAAFDGFAERVRGAYRQHPFLVAAFHPGAASSFTGPHQLVSFLRRTPDPTLQLVRAELIDRLKQNQADVSEAIAQANHTALMTEARHVELDRAVRAIHADRQATYAAFSRGPDTT